MSLWALAGIGLSALGSYNQQKTQNAYLKYQASMNRINARLANMSAESALRSGEKLQQQIMTQTAKLKGAQKTGLCRQRDRPEQPQCPERVERNGLSGRGGQKSRRPMPSPTHGDTGCRRRTLKTTPISSKASGEVPGERHCPRRSGGC